MGETIHYKADKQKVVDEASRRDKLVRIRMMIVGVVCLIGFVVVLSRAVYLHLADNKKLHWIAKKQYNAKLPVSIRRGRIFDRNGKQLAISLPVPSLYADPGVIDNPAEVAKVLAPIINVSGKDLEANLRKSRRFVWLKRRMSFETLKKVVALDLPGIYHIEESKRFYPNGELASQVLGAVGYDSQALAGIEMAYSDVLTSKKRSVYYKRDARGKLYAKPVAYGEQLDIGEIYLTIDKKIQFITENALRRAVEKTNAKDGMAVVMDPNTGDVLAMASAPVFDPNRYSKYPIETWRNRPVTDTFEPGSTFKVLVVASALNDGIVTAETIYDCQWGAIRIGKDTLKDHHPYGELSVQDIIKKSSNIGALKIAFDLGKEKLYDSLKLFGIGTKAEMKFPGEAGGILRNYKTWQPVEHATVAFGQGLTATPLQMAAAFSAAVNGGIYYRPHIVARIVDHDGDVNVVEPEEVARPIRPDVSETIRYMLKRVVEEEGGTGANARSEFYTIGGKTGTAQKVVRGARGYAKDKFFASFVGVAPVEDPKIVVFVGIDEPKGAYYGGTVAAPVVKEIVEQSLNVMGVPSTHSPIVIAAQEVPEMLVMAPELAEETIEERPVVNFEKVGDQEYAMPDLSGHTLREILVATQDIGIDVETEGSGIAILQNPEPGTPLEQGGQFSVKFALPR